MEQAKLTSKDLASVLDSAQYSPDLIISHVLKRVSSVSKGDVMYHDPNNPPVFLLEFASTLAAHCLTNTDSRQRELYSRLAQNENELYHHMSSRDYVGRFAYPSQATFRVMMRKADILALAVETDVKGLRKLVFPRGTTFKVDTIEFTLLYPIEIQVTRHGDMQILYDIEQQDPVQPLATNMLEYAFVQTTDPNDDHFVEDFIMFEPVVKQLSIEYHLGSTISALSGYKKTVKLKDQYVFARVYMYEEDGRVTELETTHSDFVFDPQKPTALLQLTTANTLTIIIPTLYATNNQIRGRIDVEVYTTKGPLDLELTTYNDGNKVGISWSTSELMRQLYEDRYQYIDPLTSLNTILATVQGRATGGSTRITFEELRDRVVNHVYYTDKPISDLHLTNNGKRMGYDITKAIDLVTNRIYRATRELPPPHYSEESFDITDVSITEPPFTTGAASTIQLVKMSMEELEGISTIKNNGNRMTIMPSTLFRTVDGITTVVTDRDHPKQVGLVDSFIQQINSLEYSYTPFHYCLDANDNIFEVRPYYMEDPKVRYQRFIRSNHTTQHLVSVDTIGHEIEYTETGYRFYIRARSGDSYKEIPKDKLFAQLAFKPVDELDFAFVNGQFVGRYDNGTDLWMFEIESQFDFTKDHRLILNNFSIYTREPRPLEIQLDHEFHVFFGVYDLEVEDFEPNEIDSLLGKQILDWRKDIKALSQTSMQVKLGTALERFWRNHRVVSSVESYERYPEHVYATYTENVYQYDDKGLVVWDGEGDDARPVVLHRIGDPITEKQIDPLTNDPIDVPVILHLAGSVKLDSQGRPIPLGKRKLMQFVDIFLVDGIYQFANSEFDRKYAKSIPQTIVHYLEQDIETLAKNVLENTTLYFTPKQTMGTTEIIVRNGLTQNIVNRIPFHVTYYMSRVGYADMPLRNAIKHMTHKVINEYIKGKTVSVDGLTTLLRNEAGDEVMAVSIPGLGEGYNIQAYTHKSDDSRCSVKRRMKLDADGTFRVIEDITVEFINHETSLNE